MENSLIKELGDKTRELSEWLRANFNPHTSILIDDRGVQLLTEECFIPNPTYDEE